MKINWRYTIGEIIIVLIGISLAFSLNNFKENVQQKKLKKQYIENLRLDSQEEVKQLEQIQADISEKIKFINQIRPHLGNVILGRDTVVKKVFEVARIVNFNPENTTYQTLINSGDMKLIDNFELRRMIEGHYSLHEDVLQNYKRLENIYSQYVGDFFIREMDFVKIRQGDFAFLDDVLFGGIINSIEGSYYLAIEANKKCLASNIALLEALQGEMEE